MSHSRYGRADHGPGQAASAMTSAPRSSSALRSSLTRGSRVCRKILICAVLLILSAAPSNSEEGRPWLPTAPHLHKLSTKAEVGAYQLRVPEGYVLRTQSGPGGSMAHAWVGSPRSDGTRPYVMLTMGAPAPGETNPYTLTQVLAKFLAGIERRRKKKRGGGEKVVCVCAVGGPRGEGKRKKGGGGGAFLKGGGSGRKKVF